MTDPSNTSVTAQFGAGERGDPIERVAKVLEDHFWRDDRDGTDDGQRLYIWTAARLAIEAMLLVAPAAPVSHTSVKDGGGVPEREVHWLVERKGTGLYIKKTAGSMLTDNVWQADRFNNEREAFDFVRLDESFTAGELVAVEHMFINKLVTGSDAVADGARVALAQRALEAAAARFNLMAGVGRINGADPKVGHRECMEAIAALRSAPVKAAPSINENWSCAADFLDDIEVDANGMCRWADVANAQTHIRHSLRSVQPPAPVKDGGSEVMRECDWPANTPFKFLDEPGEHEPCYVVMPGGAMLPLNHHVGEGVDIARAKFIVAACNAALVSADSNDEFYELGKRDGYEDAIQDLDIATGGDGEFKGSTIPGETVDVPTMKARIISRAVPARATSAHHARAIAEILDPVAFDPISLRNDQHPTWMCRRETAIETANKILSLAPVKAVGSEALPISAKDAIDIMNGYLTVYARYDGTFEIRGAKKAAEAIELVARHNVAALAHPGSGDAEPGAWRATAVDIHELAAWLIALEDAEMYVPVPLSLVAHGRALIHAGLTEKHSGDCTKESHACIVCHTSDAIAKATQIAAAIATPQAPAQTLQHHTGDGE